MWGMGAVVLVLFAIGGISFGIRNESMLDFLFGVLLMGGAIACARKALRNPPRPVVSGRSGHSDRVWE